MDKHGRLATGDKIEVIDSLSPYFGKIGEVRDIVEEPLSILENAERREGKIVKVYVELAGVNTLVDFWSYPKRLDSQIRKL
jgi:hypothetical protein